MSKNLKKTLICLLIGTFSTWLFGATKTIVLQNGLNEYSGTNDSYMSSNMETPSTDPKGAENSFITYEWYSWGKAFARAAISFELPEAISGTTIKSAKLSIYFQGGTPADFSTAFRLTQDWVEDELTWFNASSSETWATPWDDPQDPNVVGKDIPPTGMIDATDSARTITSKEGNVWEEYDVTKIIQKYADGTPNYGFLLRNDDYGGNTSRLYFSSEYEDDLTLRPKLEIVYETDENSNTKISKLSSLNIIEKIQSTSQILYSLDFIEKYEITLSTITGKTLKRFSGVGKGTFTIDKNSLSSSCYLLTLKREGHSKVSERLMIVK